MACIFLTACSGESNISTVFPSHTPAPISTVMALATNTTISAQKSSTATAKATSTLISTPTRIQPTTLPPTPTFTPFPIYNNKVAIFDYSVIGNLSDWDEFFDPPSGNIVTRLVLYDDGQLLIAGPGETYTQKSLSSAEMKSFLSKIESLGFYSLESNQQQDQTDKLYDFGNNYQEVNDGLWDCITVHAEKSRTLCVRESYVQFLVPKMKGILQYFDEYKPEGLTPYYPDRILLSISIADPENDTLPATVIPWDEHFPSLGITNPRIYTYDNPNPILYVDGDMAKEIYLLFKDTSGSKVFLQNGKEYFVYIRVLLPDEKVKNAYQ
jgi:hypothetical protein